MRLPLNVYRASTYAAIAPKSMVITRDSATTRTLLTKYCPMWAVRHARSQFCQRSADGSPHGSVRISSSSLNELVTAQINGYAVSTAQLISTAWENTLTMRAFTARPDRGG